jgi:hypothetical protein
MDGERPSSPPGSASTVTVVNKSGCDDWRMDVQACTMHARITVATPQQVCAEVTIPENSESAFVDVSKFELASDSAGGRAEGTVTSRHNRSATFPGIYWQSVNYGRGVEARQRVYRFDFATRGFCSPNTNGLLTPQTRWIEARFLAFRGENVAFRWNLQGS